MDLGTHTVVEGSTLDDRGGTPSIFSEGAEWARLSIQQALYTEIPGRLGCHWNGWQEQERKEEDAEEAAMSDAEHGTPRFLTARFE